MAQEPTFIRELMAQELASPSAILNNPVDPVDPILNNPVETPQDPLSALGSWFMDPAAGICGMPPGLIIVGIFVVCAAA